MAEPGQFRQYEGAVLCNAHKREVRLEQLKDYDLVKLRKLARLHRLELEDFQSRSEGELMFEILETEYPRPRASRYGLRDDEARSWMERRSE